MTAIAELEIASPAEPWRRLGLVVDHGRARVGLVDLCFRPTSTEPGSETGTGTGSGIVGWTLIGAEPEFAAGSRTGSGSALDIDGLSTRIVAESTEPTVPAVPAAHPIGASRIDHIVVMTPSLDRTSGALAAMAGEPLKRVRDAGNGVRQGFHRFGEVVVEVVERSDLPADSLATFWGLVLVVAQDLHDVCAQLGPEVVGLPKPAVQPGRTIATVRPAAELGLPVALMSA